MEVIDSDLEMLECDETQEDLRRVQRIDLIRKLKSNDVWLSHSSFNEFCKSPKHFIDYKLKDKKQTPAMAFGSMAHCAILEPDEFDSRYFVLPESQLSKNSNAYKALKAEWILDAGEKTVVSASDYRAAQRIAESIRRNDSASAILDKCTDFEVRLEWEYKGLNWVGYVDGDGRKNGLILDLKVLADVTPRAVANYVKYEGAGRQAVHYLRGGKAEDCDYFILAVDRSGNCSVSKIGKGLLQQLSRDIDWHLAQFKKCVFLGEWGSSYDFFSPDGYFEINSL